MTQSQMMLRSGSTASKGTQSSKSSMRVSSHKTMMEKFKKASGLDKTSTMSKEPEQRYMTKHIKIYQPKPPTEIAELLQLFYSVAMEDPANLADTIHKLHEEYKQNPKKSEQFCILHAFGEKYHLTHSFPFAPDNWKDSDNAQIKEHHGKPILFTGFESEVGRDLLTLTADPADLFGLKTKQLASWDACCKLTDGFAATDDETAKTVGAFPFLPIIGRDWCAKVANGLYPMDISKSWT
ncbi:expressed unknown protein (Partial), partial [Seminavis robusta]